jgi:hypothetical protein
MTVHPDDRWLVTIGYGTDPPFSHERVMVETEADAMRLAKEAIDRSGVAWAWVDWVPGYELEQPYEQLVLAVQV